MLKFPGLHESAPCLLPRVESLLTRHALRPLNTATGEREHRVGTAFGPTGRVLPDVPGTNHALHGPASRVRVSLEVSLGQVAGGDAAVHTDVRQRPVYPVLEVLAFRAGIVFPPVAAALPLFPFFGVVAPLAGCGTASGISG